MSEIILLGTSYSVVSLTHSCKRRVGGYTPYCKAPINKASQCEEACTAFEDCIGYSVRTTQCHIFGTELLNGTCPVKTPVPNNRWYHYPDYTKSKPSDFDLVSGGHKGSNCMAKGIAQYLLYKS